MIKPNIFDDVTDEPCPVCLELAQKGSIQTQAVMPLPKFPARLRADGRQCCRDCEATESTMSLIGNHPQFAAARLTVANERLEGLRMPLGMMKLFGMCAMGYVRPCSTGDLKPHLKWLEKHGIDDVILERGEDYE